MTDPVERKEWAEGLREELAEVLWDHAWSKFDGESGTRAHIEHITDTVVAVVEPRVISLAGEVERLTDALADVRHQAIQTNDSMLDSLDRIQRIVAAALSPHPSERKGP